MGRCVDSAFRKEQSKACALRKAGAEIVKEEYPNGELSELISRLI
jgi:hypothetical protein